MVYNLPHDSQRPSPEYVSFPWLYVMFRYKQVCGFCEKVFYLYLFCSDCQLGTKKKWSFQTGDLLKVNLW